MTQFNEDAWHVERTPLRMGVGETGESLNLPDNVTIVLMRVGNTDWFNVVVDGEPLDHMIQKDMPVLKRISEWLS